MQSLSGAGPGVGLAVGPGVDVGPGVGVSVGGGVGEAVGSGVGVVVGAVVGVGDDVGLGEGVHSCWPCGVPWWHAGGFNGPRSAPGIGWPGSMAITKASSAGRDSLTAAS